MHNQQRNFPPQQITSIENATQAKVSQNLLVHSILLQGTMGCEKKGFFMIQCGRKTVCLPNSTAFLNVPGDKRIVFKCDPVVKRNVLIITHNEIVGFI